MAECIVFRYIDYYAGRRHRMQRYKKFQGLPLVGEKYAGQLSVKGAGRHDRRLGPRQQLHAAAGGKCRGRGIRQQGSLYTG